jgi:peptidoglycan/LPS O-acetylase OafA/YrhL
MNQQSRYKSLDFLRGTAVLLVIIEHFFHGYVESHFCWTGVDLFFVLSGFFVSGILFREYSQHNTMHGGRFFVRRVFKIWPLFYTAFVIEFLYFCVKHRPPSTAQSLAELFFVQNYFQGFMQVTWSLGIEEQFYLLVAIILPLLAHFNKVNWIVPACMLVMVTALALRILNYFSLPQYQPYPHHYALQLRADSLAAGVLISWYYHFKHQEFKSWVTSHTALLFYLSTIFLLPAFIFSYKDPRIFTLGFTSVWLGYSCIVVLFVFLPGTKPFWSAVFNKNKFMLAIAWVGFYSYAIYLFHSFIGPGIVSNFRRYVWPNAPTFVQFLIFLSADIIFGFLVSNAIEQPVLTWRNRVFPPKERKPAQL